MKLRKKLAEWGLTSLKLNLKYLEMEFQPTEPDRAAAWDLYIELLTRITTQPLDENDGDEKSALNSVFGLFALVRQILKERGRGCREFLKISVVVLNQIVRPFTAKWHRLSLQGAFEQPERCREFRAELREVQAALRNYTKLLADLAEVEDLSALAGEPEGEDCERVGAGV